MQEAPGKSYREGISIMELADMFPDEESAAKWFESIIWPDGRFCPRCGCAETSIAAETSGLPYYCPGCQKPFSVRIGTALQRSKISLRKWVFAIYLEMTSLKGVSSMKLHRDIKVTQKTAWFMLHRIREAFAHDLAIFAGPVEVDETFFGGKRRNMSNAQRKETTGRGIVGKSIVVGAKDRETNQVKAQVIPSTDSETLQRFIRNTTADDVEVYTDEHRGYVGIPNPHRTVKHSVAEYVNGKIHTNGIESFWSMLKRAHKGVYHKMSPKHLQRYIDEFAGRHNLREGNTIEQMQSVVTKMVGKSLMYQDLIADNGLDSGARG